MSRAQDSLSDDHKKEAQAGGGTTSFSVDELVTKSTELLPGLPETRAGIVLNAAKKSSSIVTKSEYLYKKMKIVQTAADIFVETVFSGGVPPVTHRPDSKEFPFVAQDMVVCFSLPQVFEYLIVPMFDTRAMMGGASTRAVGAAANKALTQQRLDTAAGAVIKSSSTTSAGGDIKDDDSSDGVPALEDPTVTALMNQKQQLLEKAAKVMMKISGSKGRAPPSPFLFKDMRWWEFLDEVEFEILQRLANEALYRRSSFDLILANIREQEQLLTSLEKKRKSSSSVGGADGQPKQIEQGSTNDSPPPSTTPAPSPETKSKWRMKAASETRLRHLLNSVEQENRRNPSESGGSNNSGGTTRKGKKGGAGAAGGKGTADNNPNSKDVPVFSLAMSPKKLDPEIPVHEQVLDCPRLDARRKHSRKAFNDHHARLWRHYKKETKRMYECYEEMDRHWLKMFLTPLKELKEEASTPGLKAAAAAHATASTLTGPRAGIVPPEAISQMAANILGRGESRAQQAAAAATAAASVIGLPPPTTEELEFLAAGGAVEEMMMRETPVEPFSSQPTRRKGASAAAKPPAASSRSKLDSLSAEAEKMMEYLHGAGLEVEVAPRK